MIFLANIIILSEFDIKEMKKSYPRGRNESRETIENMCLLTFYVSYICKHQLLITLKYKNSYKRPIEMFLEEK